MLLLINQKKPGTCLEFNLITTFCRCCIPFISFAGDNTGKGVVFR